MARRFSLPFTATVPQILAYLFCVALFSIAFLVFLNSTVSFVITSLLNQHHGVGNAVGTLGFADELVALVFCPIWGLVSDRLGVRNVCVLGYAIVGLSLFVFVQARNVYPHLLLARILFSVGGAATSTMVTAVLPCMTAERPATDANSKIDADPRDAHPEERRSRRESISTAATSPTITPESYHSPESSTRSAPKKRSRGAGTSQTAGLVGCFTGVGALVALALFLPLPARFEKGGATPAVAVKNSFYIVGSIALAVAILSFFGLSGLAGEEHKGIGLLIGRSKSNNASITPPKTRSYASLAASAVLLGATDATIALAYLGGFVARASSVAITLFIPLYVNAYFISTGLCAPSDDPATTPGDIKARCARAYTLASMLGGVSQLVALLCAPLFGYLEGRYSRLHAPIIVAAASGIAGYVALARIGSPEPRVRDGGGPAVFAVMALLGISQIGAIVCSLSLLGRSVQGYGDDEDEGGEGAGEREALLAESSARRVPRPSREHLKGSVAGVYSLAGGAGILLLTKLGGSLFDALSTGAPFYMLAAFNGVLLVGALASAGGKLLRQRRRGVDLSM